MKFLKIIFIVQAFLLFMERNLKAQDWELIEGTVQIVYAKDTLDDGHIYLETKKEFNGHYFEDVGEIVPLLYTFCAKNDIRYPEKRRTVSDLPQYQCQKKRNRNYYIHYGGDTFMTPDEKIIITFQMKAEVIKIQEQYCESLHFQSKYSCPVERVPIEYPLVS